MKTLWKDLQFGFRMLAKNPGFTAVAILSMAIGIGANSTIFSLMDSVLLRPLHVKNPNELVIAYSKTPKEPYRQTSYPDYTYYRDNNQVFSGVAAFTLAAAGLRSNEQTEFLFGEIVSGNYFSILGREAALGRTFLPEEDQTPDSHPVVVFGHSLWQRRFNADPNLVGRTVKFNGKELTVIGIMPPNCKSLLRGYVPDFWVPMMLNSIVKVSGDDMLTNRADRPLYLIGRLKPGMSMKQAEVGLAVQAQQLAQAYPEIDKEQGVTLSKAGEFLLEPNFRSVLTAFMSLLMAVVGLVLLIACANVANLLLARMSARKKEIAIRLAMGSGRGRLIRQLLTESVLLSALGGVVGLLLALWASQLLTNLKPSFPISVEFELGLNFRILVFTFLVSLLTGVLFGLAPALHASKLELVPLLKDEAGKGGFKKSRMRNLLVISQISLSLILLIGAALSVRSLQNAQSIDPGFETKNRLAALPIVDIMGYTESQGREMYRRLQVRIENLPGVQSVSCASALPLGFSYSGRGVLIEGVQPPPDQKSIYINCNQIAPNYFRTMGISLLQGRDFTPLDNAEAPKVVIINEAMAQKYWPGQNPVGNRFRLDDKEQTPFEVIGVVRTCKYRTLGEEPRPFMHFALLQQYHPAPHLLVHTTGNPKSFFSSVRNIFREVDDNVPLLEIKTMEEHLNLLLLPQRLAGAVLGIMGLLALLLAAIGIYGVMSYSVSQRTQEIGIRMALGAKCKDVLALVVKQGMSLAGIGIGLGLIAALVLSRFLAYLLYGISAADPVVFFAIPLFLGAVAGLACYLPARRAAKVDPMTALRYE